MSALGESITKMKRVLAAYRELVCNWKKMSLFPKDTAVHKGSWLAEPRLDLNPHSLLQPGAPVQRTTHRTVHIASCVKVLKRRGNRRSQG